MTGQDSSDGYSHLLRFRPSPSDSTSKVVSSRLSTFDSTFLFSFLRAVRTMSDPLLALLGDANSLFPGVPAAVSSGTASGLRERGGEGEIVVSPGTNPSKMFAVANLDRLAPGICFGLIGNGGSFCFKEGC